MTSCTLLEMFDFKKEKNTCAVILESVSINKY